jgi:pimeloyl-ACP methyl ester carboxylesterase
VEDILAVLDYVKQDALLTENQLCLLGHSMGGFSAGFAAHRFKALHKEPLLLGFLCPLKTLDVRTPEVMAEWKKNGVYFRLNSRTNQQLPQGAEFLSETLQSGGAWNLEDAIRSYPDPVFVAHAVDDESVPFEHGRSIFSWLYKNNMQNGFLPIPGANHTLNTAHPMKRDSAELQFFLENFVAWLQHLK